jgi:hypothetical protein
VDLVGVAAAQRMLAEEEHEAGAVLVERAPLLLDQAHALDNIDQLDLLVARQLRDVDAREPLVNLARDLLGKRALVFVVERAVLEVLSGIFI